MTSDLINLIANIALALSFIVGLVFGIVQVRAAARDRRERLTLDSLHHFQSREFVELFHRITSMKLPVNRDGMRALPEADKIMIIQYAQEMESLGLLVAERLINVALVDKTIGSLSHWYPSRKRRARPQRRSSQWWSNSQGRCSAECCKFRPRLRSTEL